jgi:NTP pyrophosphatase (non-canonical NTP hydrolase)
VYRAKLLGTLAPHLPYEEQGRVYQQALEGARAIRSEEDRAKVLGTLAPHLPHEVLEAARAIRHEEDRAKVLGMLAPHLPHEVLEAARAIRHEEYRAEVLGTLAPHLPHEVLEAARAITDERYRVQMLGTLAPLLATIALSQRETGRIVWQDTLHITATRPRPDLLSDLKALMPFTLVLVQKFIDHSTLSHAPPHFSNTQRTHLRNWMNDVPLQTTQTRLRFLENAGIQELEPHLLFDVPQAAFIQDLLRLVTDAGNAPDGEPYLVKLLRYLHDVEWEGHPDRRAFIAELLGTSTTTSNQTRLAQGILEAVQAVCTWWP